MESIVPTEVMLADQKTEEAYRGCDCNDCFDFLQTQKTIGLSASADHFTYFVCWTFKQASM